MMDETVEEMRERIKRRTEKAERESRRTSSEEKIIRRNIRIARKINKINMIEHDPRRYCPLNSKARGENQLVILDRDEFEPDIGNCKLDGEKCQHQTCETFQRIFVEKQE